MLVVTYLAYFAEILPIFFYLVFFNRNKGEGLWVIFLYCILSLLTEGIFRITHFWAIFLIFIVVQFTLFSFFFYSSLKDRRFKLIPIIGAVIFYAFAIANFNNTKYDSISASLASVLIIPYCILLLYEQIKDPNTLFVYYNKKFWVIIAFFLYFSATLFLYIFYNTLSSQQRLSFWIVNNFFEILKNILFSVSFIMKKHNDVAPESLEYIDN